MGVEIMRIGQGFDVHTFGSGRKLILGGVDIPYYRGLVGHSDADVLLHAVCDALLGAAGLGDIGRYFPDTDMQYKDIDSRILLRQTMALVEKQGYRINNVDCTIIAQAPRIGPFRDQMRAKLSAKIGIPLAMTSVKATTTEGLGYLGRREGIAAMCIVQLEAYPSS